MGRVTGGLIIVFLCSFLGALFAKKFRAKSLYLEALESFCVYLKREISFSRTTIKSVVTAFSTDNEDFRATLSCCFFAAEGDNGTCFPEYLNADEKKFISGFFDKLGKSDRENELEFINAFSAELKRIKEDERAVCKKRTALSTKLGFFTGAIIFVILL